MQPEPNRESTMDEQIADMDGISNAGSDSPAVRTPTVSSDNFTLLQHCDCRICFEASGEDPMLELGCQCRDDLRFVHQSCLMKWFAQRVLRTGTADCELCRSALAAHVQTIVMSSIQEAISGSNTLGVPHIILLLQVPPEELDRLEVPIETPDFYELSPRLRRSLLGSLRRQEEAHRRGETRRTANFIMAQDLASRGEGPLRPQELQARVRRVAQLRDQIIGGSNEELRRHDEDVEGDTNITEDLDLEILRERPVIRVDVDLDIPTGEELENLLDDLSLHVDLLAENTSGDMLYIPSSMYLDNVNSARGNLTRISTEGVVRRRYTYGEFGSFLVHDIF